MNVIVANKQQSQLSVLDIDIIKSISGTYEATEIVEMFKNFFYSKMILDVTAIKNNEDINNFQIIAKGLDAEKIVFFLPEGSNLCTSNFLSKLISMGIYNFTTNIDGVKYLIKKANTYKDVAHIQQLSNNSIANNIESNEIDNNNNNNNNTNTNNSNNGNDNRPSQPVTVVTRRVSNGPTIIGIKNVTDQAGATTFTYILKKELTAMIGPKIVAIEVNKNDFQLFNDKNMVSATSSSLRNVIDKYRDALIILIDLNDLNDDTMCGDVLYLLEPSTIKLNKLIRKNRNIFTKLKNKKVILNKSLLTNRDINDFEYESNIKVIYNMPPLNERSKNEVVRDFLYRIGILEKQDQGRRDGSNRIFGLFRR